MWAAVTTNHCFISKGGPRAGVVSLMVCGMGFYHTYVNNNLPAILKKFYHYHTYLTIVYNIFTTQFYHAYLIFKLPPIVKKFYHNILTNSFTAHTYQ